MKDGESEDIKYTMKENTTDLLTTSERNDSYSKSGQDRKILLNSSPLLDDNTEKQKLDKLQTDDQNELKNSVVLNFSPKNDDDKDISGM